ncbi:MAG: CocE/NonD family hydrolase [Gammaproteobacteria bacterium]
MCGTPSGGSPMTIVVEKNVAVPMRDSVELRADIYRPSAAGRYPVLLQRTPYNKELWPVTAATLDPLRAAAAGYAVIIQDVRARWASAGELFFPYRHETQDGADSLAWAARQSFSSGQVGCYGLSYMGGTSWLAALSANPALKAISPTTAPNDFWRNHFWRQGVLNLGTLAMWSLRAIGPAALIRARPAASELGALLTQLFDDVDAFEEVLRALPLRQFRPGRPEDGEFLPFFYEMLEHPVPDSWTAELLFSNRHAEVTVPSLSIAGWHDLLLAADLEHFSAMRERGGSELARTQSRLVIGPWAHGMFQNVVGEIDFGFRANGMFLDLKEDLTRLQLRWFDRWVRGERNGFDDEPPVRIFVQGINRWQDADTWPPAGTLSQSWYLASGAALVKNRAGADGADSYVFDPYDPCPTRGGNLLLPQQYTAGPVDQRAILDRRDVLTYVSSPLTADLAVVGSIRCELHASTSGLDTDWVVKFCEVHPDGRVMNICDGVVRASLRDGETRRLVAPGQVLRYDIDLWSTATVLRAGHRIALIVTSSDFPRYDRNPNTGEFAHHATKLESALQRIHFGSRYPSRLMLSVQPA